jgi:hypothetical protein
MFYISNIGYVQGLKVIRMFRQQNRLLLGKLAMHLLSSDSLFYLWLLWYVYCICREYIELLGTFPNDNNGMKTLGMLWSSQGVETSSLLLCHPLDGNSGH